MRACVTRFASPFLPACLLMVMCTQSSAAQSHAGAATASVSPVIRARQLIAADSAEQAVDLLKTAIASGNDSAPNHLWLAAAYSEQGAKANLFSRIFFARRVKNELLHAVALDSSSVDAHSELARYYLTASTLLGGSLTEAQNEAHKVATASVARSHVLLGYVAHHRGDLKTAEREMRLAVAAAPDSAWPCTALAFLLGEQQRNDEAFAYWEKSVALDSTYKDSYLEMGLIGANTGTHLGDAARALEHYIASPPHPRDARSRATANNRLGLVYEKLGRRSEARRAYEQAITLAPSNSKYKASLKNLGDADTK